MLLLNHVFLIMLVLTFLREGENSLVGIVMGTIKKTLFIRLVRISKFLTPTACFVSGAVAATGESSSEVAKLAERLKTMEDLQKEHTNKQEQLEHSQNKLKQTQIQLEKTQAQHEKTQAQHEKAQAQHEKAQAQHEKTQAQHEKAQAQHEKAQAQHEKTQAQHEKAQAQLEKAQAQHEKAQAQLEKAQAQLEKAQAQHEKAQAQLEKAQAQLEKTQTQFKVSQKKQRREFTNAQKRLSEEIRTLDMRANKMNMDIKEVRLLSLPVLHLHVVNSRRFKNNSCFYTSGNRFCLFCSSP